MQIHLYEAYGYIGCEVFVRGIKNQNQNSKLIICNLPMPYEMK